jgi:hypothetical protein
MDAIEMAVLTSYLVICGAVSAGVLIGLFLKLLKRLLD